MKEFADYEIKVAQMIKFTLDWLENTVTAFSPFPTKFSKAFLYRLIKSQFVW